MDVVFDDVFDAARDLPETDRVRLIDQLIATLEPASAVPLDAQPGFSPPPSEGVFNSRGVLAIDLNVDGAVDLVFNNEVQTSTILPGRADRAVARRERRRR